MNERVMSQQSLVGSLKLNNWHGVILLGLLMATLLLGLGSSIHSRLLWLGEQTWNDYYLLDPHAKAPECNPSQDVDAAVAAQMAEAESDSFGLFDSKPDKAAIRASIEKNVALCQEKHAKYTAMQAQITPWLVAYKTVERSMAAFLIDNMALQTYLFMGLMGLAAATAAFSNEHISLRLPGNRAEWRLAETVQLIVNGLMVWSLQSYVGQLNHAPDTAHLVRLQDIWSGAFGLLMIVNVARLLFVPEHYESGKLGPRSLLAIPLYCWMGLIAFGYFALATGQPSGVAINFGQMANLSSMFINIGLYVFVGMCLKQTRLPEKLLAIVKPWNLPPAALASLVIFATAFPTAFTGASGIFVLAVGGVIYEEMRRAGAGRQLSLATTAMSGSMGVVLNPCLLIVVVAALNKEVTTSQLYGWGYGVFLFSALLFTLIVCRSEGRWKPDFSNRQAKMQASLQALKPLWIYVAVSVLVIAGFAVLLDLSFNEHSAPMILPIIMLAFVFLDADKGPGRSGRFAAAMTRASSESAIHIGALLALIGLSICLGGVLERSQLVHVLFPESLTNVWLVMLSIVVMLTIIGMIMDPFGAVVLVSATIAQAAITRGVDPVHFWIVTLVAFELGYLSPPVALNHLLTRQVVGENEVLVAETHGTIWQRYQRLLLPLLVMGTSLLLVAFVPLFFYA
ncbi:TRAP transporter large permease subunit [Marinobacteraceae bacterium S3BR75-40.1]